MTIFDAISVNDSTIKVDNRTDYYLDQWLYSDYGFQLYYRPTRGVSEVYWKELLRENGFDEPVKIPRQKFLSAQSRNRSLDLFEFVTRTFCTEFVSGDKIYALLFDYPNSIIVISNTETFWDIL